MNKPISLDDIFPIISEQLVSGGNASFTIHGTSMLPFLKDRKDKVWITKPNRELKKYDIIFYRLDGVGFILHRIVKVTRDGVICRGDNHTDNEPLLKFDDVIALVTDYERNGVKRSVDSVFQILYSRFWVNTMIFRKVKRKIESMFKNRKGK